MPVMPIWGGGGGGGERDRVRERVLGMNSGPEGDLAVPVIRLCLLD